MEKRLDPNTPVEQARAALFAYGIVAEWILDTHQALIYDAIQASNEKELLIFCSRQWGKSFTSVVLAIEHCLRNPGSIVRIAAPTIKQVADIVSDNLDKVLQWAPKGFVKREKSSYRWTFKNGSSLRLGTTERAHVDSLRGGNASLIISEEGGFVASDDYSYACRSVIGPQLLRSNGRLIHVTTPSEEVGHYIHTEVLPKCEAKEALFRYDIYTNTALTPEQISAAMLLCGGEHTEAWRREYMVEIIKSISTSLFPNWSDSTAIAFDLPEHWFGLVATDTGGVQDRTVALLLAYDFKQNRALFVDEREFEPNTDSKTIIDGIKEMEAHYLDKIKYRWADGSGQLLTDFRKLHDYQANLPEKTDFIASLNAFRVAVEGGQVLIHPRCTLLTATCKHGTFNKQRTDFARTQALGHMDAVAAAMYAYRMLYLIKSQNPYPKIYNDPATTWTGLRTEKSGLDAMASTFKKHDRRR